MSLNEAIFLKIQALTGIPIIDQAVLFLAEALVLLVPLSLIYLWFSGREGRENAAFTVGTTVLGIGAAYAMGLLYFHENPSATYETLVTHHPENSFPSQHTAALFSAGLPLILRKRKAFGYLLTFSAVITGFARVYVGEHWPVDILGAFIASGIGLTVAYFSWAPLEPVWRPLLDIYEAVEYRVGKRLEEFIR